MMISLIDIDEVNSALHNARTIMNAYLRARINVIPNREIRVVLSEKAPDFKYEGVDGKYRKIKHFVLCQTDEKYVVQYNGNVNTASPLSDLSANELFMLCSLLESFWKHMKMDINPGIEDVEFEIVE